MSALPFAYAWRWKGGVTWKLTLNKNPNAHRDIEIKELFDHSELAATVIEQQRIITALSEDASKAAELARALQVVSAVLQSERTRSGGQPFTGRWSIPSIDWRVTVPEALDLADAALDAKP